MSRSFLSSLVVLAALSPAAAAPPADAALARLAERSPREAQVQATLDAYRGGEIPAAQAAAGLTDAEIADFQARVPGWAPPLRDALDARRAALPILERAAAGLRARREALPWPISGAVAAFAGTPSDPTETQHAVVMAFQVGGAVPGAGSLDTRTAAGLVTLAVGDPERAPGLGWAALSPEARAKLRGWLVTTDRISDDLLGRGLARAVELAGTHGRAVLVGILDAPELPAARRDAVTTALVHELAGLDYEARHRWESGWAGTVRPLLIRLLDGEHEAGRRAAATFPVWRADALGGLDRAARDIATAALSRNATRLTLVGEAHELARYRPVLGGNLLQQAGEVPVAMQPEGPWQLRSRLWTLAESHCGPLDRPDLSPPPEEEPESEDPKVVQTREVVRAGTQKMLATIEAHRGKLSRKLSFRRCEAWLKLRDVERHGSPERARAEQKASICLDTHLRRFPDDPPARLDWARLLEDTGRRDEARQHLRKLLDAPDERSRIVGSFRLLGHIEPAADGGAAPVSDDDARRAADLVSERGYNPHQRLYAGFIRAWLVARGGAPEQALRSMIGLLGRLHNADGRTVRFADVGGMIDYTNKLAAVTGAPVRQLANLYRMFPEAVQVSALLHLAHQHARYGNAAEIEAVAGALSDLPMSTEATVLLADARLREFGPQATRGGERNFDAESARQALGLLESMRTLVGGGDEALGAAARCVLIGYADGVAQTLAETGQSEAAVGLVSVAIDLAPADRHPALILRLADLEEDRGNDAEAARQYARAFEASPPLAEANPLRVLDFYQAAFRARDEALQERALALLTPHAVAAATAAAALDDEGERSEVIDAVIAVFGHAERWETLAAVGDALKTAGATAGAARACVAGQAGQLANRLEALQLGALSGDNTCTLPAAADAAALREALALAEAGLACAETPEDRWRFVGPSALLLAHLGRYDEAATRLRQGQSEHAADVREGLARFGWWALLGGDLARAESILASVDTPEAHRWAGILALSDGRAAEAVKRLTLAGEDPVARLWLARAQLADEVPEAWRTTLAALADRPELHPSILAEADRAPAGEVTTALLRQLSDRVPGATHRLRVADAREVLKKDLLPATTLRHTRPRDAARTYGRQIAPAMKKLVSTLTPVLDATDPDATALLGAVDQLVRGLDAVGVYLASHEGLKGAGSRRWTRQVVKDVAALDDQVMALGGAALKAAADRGYNDDVLRELAQLLAARYPEQLGQTRRWSLLCPDEVPELTPPTLTDPVRTTIAAFATRRPVLARAVATECAPAAEKPELKWLELRLVLDPKSPGAVSAVVSALLARFAEGDAPAAPTLVAMGAHLAGIDCAAMVKLLDAARATGATVPPDLARAEVACREDLATLRTALAELPPSPRNHRRQAELIEAFAETAEDAEAALTHLRAAALAQGWPLDTTRAAPICELPRETPPAPMGPPHPETLPPEPPPQAAAPPGPPEELAQPPESPR